MTNRKSSNASKNPQKETSHYSCRIFSELVVKLCVHSVCRVLWPAADVCLRDEGICRFQHMRIAHDDAAITQHKRDRLSHHLSLIKYSWARRLLLETFAYRPTVPVELTTSYSEHELVKVKSDRTDYQSVDCSCAIYI